MTADDPREQAVYVDADACPVKAEVYKVAERHRLRVFVVSADVMAVPRENWIRPVIVGPAFDAADDWIAERAGPGDVVVTADVPLAARCVKKGAAVIGPSGRRFDESSVGMALATRNLMQELREAGAVTGGPRPFSARDRSRFLSALHETIEKLKRAR